MQTATHEEPPSVLQLLYALILALVPWIESLEAEAVRNGFPPHPAIHRMARTIAHTRAMLKLFGLSIPANPLATKLATPAPAPASAPCAQTLAAIRRHTPEPAPGSLPPRHPSITPEPVRTLEL